jgi:hypothetical protein
VVLVIVVKGILMIFGVNDQNQALINTISVGNEPTPEQTIAEQTQFSVCLVDHNQ